MFLYHVFCNMQMFKRLLKHHVAEWARIDGWGGVGDENLFHLITQGHNVGGDRVGKRGVTKGCTYLPTVGW